ncbi:MAG: hypothetical protein ACTSYA_04255 [Candidatus Kariarchaeaceae archaeon]
MEKEEVRNGKKSPNLTKIKEVLNNNPQSLKELVDYVFDTYGKEDFKLLAQSEKISTSLFTHLDLGGDLKLALDAFGLTQRTVTGLCQRYVSDRRITIDNLRRVVSYLQDKERKLGGQFLEKLQRNRAESFLRELRLNMNNDNNLYSKLEIAVTSEIMSKVDSHILDTLVTIISRKNW